jgi:hypothetical protein
VGRAKRAGRREVFWIVSFLCRRRPAHPRAWLWIPEAGAAAPDAGRVSPEGAPAAHHGAPRGAGRGGRLRWQRLGPARPVASGRLWRQPALPAPTRCPAGARGGRRRAHARPVAGRAARRAGAPRRRGKIGAAVWPALLREHGRNRYRRAAETKGGRGERASSSRGPTLPWPDRRSRDRPLHSDLADEGGPGNAVHQAGSSTTGCPKAVRGHGRCQTGGQTLRKGPFIGSSSYPVCPVCPVRASAIEQPCKSSL